MKSGTDSDRNVIFTQLGVLGSRIVNHAAGPYAVPNHLNFRLECPNQLVVVFVPDSESGIV